MSRPTVARMANTAQAAISAMLSGEEHEGDWPEDVSADELRAAQSWLADIEVNAGKAIPRPRLTARCLRGLAKIASLAHADVMGAEPGDFTDAQRADFDAAFAWLNALPVKL